MIVKKWHFFFIKNYSFFDLYLYYVVRYTLTHFASCILSAAYTSVLLRPASFHSELLLEELQQQQTVVVDVVPSSTFESSFLEKGFPIWGGRKHILWWRIQYVRGVRRNKIARVFQWYYEKTNVSRMILMLTEHLHYWFLCNEKRRF